MGHKILPFPGVHFSDNEETKLKALAKKGVTADERIAANDKKVAAVKAQLTAAETKARDAQVEANHWHRELVDLQVETKDYRRLAKSFPSQVNELFENLTREEKTQEQQREAERQAQQAQRQQHKKSHGIGGR